MLLLSLVIAASCRTRVTTPPFTLSDPTSVPPPAAARIAETVVANPQGEFGTTTPEPKVSDVADIESMERAARERGEIRDAFFQFDASTLDADAREALDKTATWLRLNPRNAILIEGHCDERGTEQYNLALGDRRGATAADYLATLGVARERIATVSYGEERPFATGSDEEAWKQNRRAHIKVR